MMREYIKDIDCWIILTLCSLLPITIIQYTAFANIAMILLLLIFILLKRPSIIIVYIAIVACFPLIKEGGTFLPFKMMNRIRLVFPLLLLIINFAQIKKTRFVKKYIFLVLFYIFIASIWYGINLEYNELYGPINIVTMYLPVLIYCYSSKLKLEDYFKYFDIIVFVIGIYTTVEFFFRWNPYTEVANFGGGELSEFDIASVFRCRGLTGNSIVLADVFLFEFCFIIFRSYINKKLNAILLIIVAFFSMLTVSRTSTLGLLIVIGAWLFFSSKARGRIQIKYLLFLALGFLIVFNAADVAINYLFERNSDVSSDFSIVSRWSYFSNVFQILVDNPFGVGASQLMHVIYTHYSSLYNFVVIDTVDNVFLAQLGQYGALGFLTIYMLYYWYFYACKYRHESKLLFYGISTIAIMLAFSSFTHEWNVFSMPLIMLSSISGLIIRDMEDYHKSLVLLRKNDIY